MAKELTGKKVLMILICAFGTIIAVNVFMAYKAIGTFPGLEVKNSYVASQSFDAERGAQEALGWTVEPTYSEGVLSFVIRDAQGLPAPIAKLEALIGRTTHVRDDQTPEFAYSGGIYSTEIALEPGAWLIHLTAEARDGTPFRQRLDFFVKG